MVIDSMGIGAMDDAPLYNDTLSCNTLVNVAKAVGGLNLPTMQKMGLGNIADIKGVEPVGKPCCQYGIMKSSSKGKCTTTGHWEIMGLILDEPFRTYPSGFDKEIIDTFIQKTGCKGILGNYSASGTAIIEDLHAEHVKTGYPIVYTSADSVFQIAVDIDIIPLEKLYEWCEIARGILHGEHSVSRVIARPYKIVDNKPVRVSKYRHDYALKPHKPTLLNELEAQGVVVYGIGKIEDIFVSSGITKSVHTGTNQEGLEFTLEVILQNPVRKELIFTNLVDTDMLYGHRNDPIGYGQELERIDKFLPRILEALKADDLLIITADHGCDPTVEGTDHTREMVPLLVCNQNIKAKNLGKSDSFSYVANLVRDWLLD